MNGQNNNIEESKNQRSQMKINIILLLFLGLIIVVTILSALYKNIGEVFDLTNWFGSDTLETIPIYIAIGFTVLVCFIGAVIPIPVPYPLPITAFTATWLNSNENALILITLLVLSAAISNTLGDMLDWFIGRGAQELLSRESPELQNPWSQLILRKPKIIPLIILLFGATPLPESILLTTLGFLKYNKKKVLLYCFIGKIIMMVFFALLGIVSLSFLSLFSKESGPNGWISGILMLYILWILIVIMVKFKPKVKDEKER
ncbi:MAG: hypothetical protein ACTSYC_12620 [Promethearchaeota archaeon]